MIAAAIMFAFACFSIALLINMWRLIASDGLVDRILALDTMVINVIAVLVLYTMQSGSQLYFEASIIIAMLGFVSTVAYARFMLRGNIIE